jgi:NodT family efflux transporter outer membrane factor (OMF) lipoprotein
MNGLKWIAVSAVLVSLAGCMVGPNYHKPDVPMAPAWKEEPPAVAPDGNAWKNAQPDDQALRGKWWEIFHDPELNTLEEQVTTSNQDLKVAEAHYREARAMIRFSRAAEMPTIGASPQIVNERESVNQPYFNKSIANNGTGNFTLPVDFSWEIDLWGRIRRQVTAAREEAQASAADVQNASLSLHADLAMDYFELRSADAQKQLLDQTVKDYEDALQLTTNRFEGGAAPKSDVAQAQTQLDAARVQDTDIGVQRAQFEHAIAILSGQPPAKFTLPETPLHTEPPVIPPGLPSELLERRPDIAAGERRVGEANEQIGIARSAYYPSLTLAAEGGFEGTTITNWMNWPSRFWAVGPTLAETIFDGGRRRATNEGAVAGYDAAVATYRQTALTAFMEVENNLAALRVLQQESRQQQHATASAAESLQLFKNRYEGGVDNYLQVITAQTTYLANERNDIDIMRRRMDSSVLLIKALGGGWDTSQLPKL